ncbi:hypothetical protein AcW1_002782 [Taiwanofungus camphoratus]|nr:hypothetical protein AcV7_002302 [Antrodia cinnamomea]KAI0943681.1 hypothetical protein AcW1_002782 [Antrodia cinnamomea]
MVPFTDGAQWPATGDTVQPVLISLAMTYDLRQAGQNDDLTHSIDYSSVLSSLAGSCTSCAFSSLEALADQIFESCFDIHPDVGKLSITISRPKILLHAHAAGIEFERQRTRKEATCEKFFIEGLECSTIVGVNPCEREEKQRVRFTISLQRLARQDAPVDFRGLATRILKSAQESSYLTLEALASSVARTALLHTGEESDCVTVRASKPSALVLAEAAEVEVSRTLQDYRDKDCVATHRSELCPATLAPAPFSSYSVSPTSAPEAIPTSSSLSSLLASLPPSPGSQGPTSYKHRAAIALGANLGDRFANIELALRLLEAPDLDLAEKEGTPRVVVVDTSFMYETAPMYVTDQPKFINCACLIETDMEPRALLAFLKDIEATVGRVTSFRNGPRALDLDILTFDDIVMDTRPEGQRDALDNLSGELLVPHPRIAEREFVLRPLNDMIPDYVHPILGKPIRSLLKNLLAGQPADTFPMSKVVPFPRYPLPSAEVTPSSPVLHNIPPVPPTATYWTFPVSASSSRKVIRKTYIMGTLNSTPDSFSDGSMHNTLPAALAYATSSVATGADIIDIGGYSTRPRAEYVSTDEELSRVIPVIQAIRGLGMNEDGTNVEADKALPCKTSDVLISVDTFRWEVAEASVRAGANCINDVYAFTGPDYPLTRSAAEHFVKMRQVARDLAVPVVLMHSRGEASANKDYSAYNYATGPDARGAVLEGVRVELGEKVNAAIKGRGGLRRWFVIVDPGIGFSKTVEGNLELLRDAAAVVAEEIPHRNPLAGYPQLIGASRKSFLGSVLMRSDNTGIYEGRDTRPDERCWATAAAVSCAVQQRAAVVRVHDVLQLGDVVRVGTALWG